MSLPADHHPYQLIQWLYYGQVLTLMCQPTLRSICFTFLTETLIPHVHLALKRLPGKNGPMTACGYCKISRSWTRYVLRIHGDERAVPWIDGQPSILRRTLPTAGLWRRYVLTMERTVWSI